MSIPARVTVPLSWITIDWLPSETWTKHTLPKLASSGFSIKDLARSVYVIRLNGNYAVSYPKKGETPTIYVGEGNFAQRITSHRAWVHELRIVGEFYFRFVSQLHESGTIQAD